MNLNSPQGNKFFSDSDKNLEGVSHVNIETAVKVEVIGRWLYPVKMVNMCLCV